MCVSHFAAIDGERIGGGIENANVCLMEQPESDVGGRESGCVEDLARGIVEQSHGPFEDGAAIHRDEPIGIASGWSFSNGVREPPAGRIKSFSPEPSAPSVYESNPCSALPRGDEHGAGAIAEERDRFSCRRDSSRGCSYRRR